MTRITKGQLLQLAAVATDPCRQGSAEAEQARRQFREFAGRWDTTNSPPRWLAPTPEEFIAENEVAR